MFLSFFSSIFFSKNIRKIVLFFLGFCITFFLDLLFYALYKQPISFGFFISVLSTTTLLTKSTKITRKPVLKTLGNIISQFLTIEILEQIFLIACLTLQFFFFYQQCDMHLLNALITYMLVCKLISSIASRTLILILALSIFLLIDTSLNFYRNPFFTLLTNFTILKISSNILLLYFSLKWSSAVERDNRLSLGGGRKVRTPNK